MKNSVTKNANALYLLMENKLGALERILGAFTMRGYKIESMVYCLNKNPNYADIKLTIRCSDEELERLVRLLHNHINVVEIRLIIDEKEEDSTYMAVAC